VACSVVKILDATTISAFLYEIRSVDIIDRCRTVYELVTSREVVEEVMRYQRSTNVSRMSSFGTAEALTSEEIALMNYLEVRYPALHRGELSSFIIAIRYAKAEKSHYFITDDKAMRNSIEKILRDEQVIEMAGAKIIIKATGTIGLIIHLGEKGCLRKDERESIADDLSTSTFHCTPWLIQQLKS